MSTGDQLLAILSARRVLSWRAWKSTFDILHARAAATGEVLEGPLQFVRYRTLRGLFELAHCDFEDDPSSRICFAAPSVLAILPTAGIPRAVLCGARGLRTADALRASRARFREDARIISLEPEYSGGYLPGALIVEATSTAILSAIAAQSSLYFLERPPAWTLLAAARSLTDYQNTLHWHSDPDPAWPRKDFSVDLLAYVRSGAEPHNDRLSSFEDPRTSRIICRIRYGNSVADVDRTWGRWLFLEHHKSNVVLYDEPNKALAVPTWA